MQQDFFPTPYSFGVKLPAVEVSIPSGEELIGDAYNLITLQYWRQYQQNYKGEISWEKFCNGEPQNLKYLIPKDPWFSNEIDPLIVKEMTSDEPQRRVIERPEEADDKDEPDPGNVSGAGSTRSTLPVQQPSASGGFSITNPAFTIKRTVATPGCPNRATTSTTAFRRTIHRGHSTKRSSQQTGPTRGSVSGRGVSRVVHRGVGRGLRAGIKFPGPRLPNRPADTGTPTNQPGQHPESSSHNEIPPEVDLDNFVDHTPVTIQNYLDCQ